MRVRIFVENSRQFTAYCRNVRTKEVSSTGEESIRNRESRDNNNDCGFAARVTSRSGKRIWKVRVFPLAACFHLSLQTRHERYHLLFFTAYEHRAERSKETQCYNRMHARRCMPTLRILFLIIATFLHLATWLHAKTIREDIAILLMWYGYRDFFLSIPGLFRHRYHPFDIYIYFFFCSDILFCFFNFLLSRFSRYCVFLLNGKNYNLHNL